MHAGDGAARFVSATSVVCPHSSETRSVAAAASLVGARTATLVAICCVAKVKDPVFMATPSPSRSAQAPSPGWARFSAACAVNSTADPSIVASRTNGAA